MVDIRNFNLSGTLGALSLLFRPAQCLPQAVVRNFNELPLPLNKAFVNESKRFGNVNIRAVVLDKDDCFARPGETEIASEFKVRISFIWSNTISLCTFVEKTTFESTRKGPASVTNFNGSNYSSAKDYFHGQHILRRQ